MVYEIVEFVNELTDEVTEHVFITYEDGSTKSIPVDENNSEYVAFMTYLKENK
jgi:hypothetical protein